jgi:hypothetical protein
METNVKKPVYKQWWFWVIAAVLLVFFMGGEDTATTTGDPIKNFSKAHSLGNVMLVSDMDNWAEGVRKLVRTDNGNYVYYLKSNEVVTVYKYNEDGGLTEVYRK